MTIYEAITQRRTVRRFEQKAVLRGDLERMIDCARLAPFGANLQPLKYMMINDPDKAKELYPFTKWAGYLDWEPAENERPTAYIAILNDTSLKPTEKTECDSGAAVMAMCIEAMELGLGTCWLGALDRAGIKKSLGIDEKLDVTYLLAVGYPAQSGEVFDIQDSVKYYFDEDCNSHVPKRPLSEVIIK